VLIENAAVEPHVVDVATLLTEMGTEIAGRGSNIITLNGRKKLKGVQHQVVPDHIDGGTFAIAAAVTGGGIEIEDCPLEHYRMILNYLKAMGVNAQIKNKLLIVKPAPLAALRKTFKVQTWPGFPTDLMSPFIVLATQTEGTVLCHDWMYEWRIFFVDDLISMGANIFIADPHRVVVTGPSKLHGEKLYCKDIRAGMSIVLAALCAQGQSEIDNIEMVERGYEKIEERLSALGADVKRVESDGYRF
jgi:UDP-N-acetylglucosamine 1-carboxyvinyltransferase